MCGRYILTAPPEMVGRVFEVATVPPFVARYNIAPTQPIPVVRPAEGGRVVEMMSWGLVPSWVKDPATFTLLINARAETAAEKPAFRQALKKRRCIVPASGFYEWREDKVDGKRIKQPFLFTPRDGGLLAFAGIYEEHTDADGVVRPSAAILTTTANATLAPIHDRMPVILAPADVAPWLDAGTTPAPVVAALMRPASDDLLDTRPVSRRVNAARDDDPGLIEPADAGPQPPLL